MNNKIQENLELSRLQGIIEAQRKELTAKYNIEAAAKFYARASAYRAIYGFIPEPDHEADEAGWQKMAKSLQNEMVVMIKAICHAGMWR